MLEPVLRAAAAAATVGALLLLPARPARAVPSFARQTGLACTACHTVFPELTPAGRNFKLTGYVLSKSKKPYQLPPPITGGGKAFYTHTDRAQPPGEAPFDASRNDNAEWELTAYYAGKILEGLGAFAQGTYDGVADEFLLDSTDIRYANALSVGGTPLVVGITLNNDPTLQDAWNSTPAWTFPYSSSAIAPAPAALPAVFGGLSQQVGGVGAYAWWNDFVYAEVSVYRTAADGITAWLGAGTETEQVVDGLAPYWRLVLQHRWNKHHSLAAGTYGLAASIFPGGLSSGPTDRFTDIALDAQYEYITPEHMVSVQTTIIREDQSLGASFALAEAANRTDTLDLFKANAGYHYRSEGLGTVGATVAYFATVGSQDDLLYAPAPVSGSRTGSPDSNYYIVQVAYLPPWLSSKFLVQYTIYDKFNGAHTNYDGFGRDAPDNNTLFLGLWQLF